MDDRMAPTRVVLAASLLLAASFKLIYGFDEAAFFPPRLQLAALTMEVGGALWMLVRPGRWSDTGVVAVSLALVVASLVHEIAGSSLSCGCLGSAVEISPAAHLAGAGVFALIAVQNAASNHRRVDLR